ncbi:MAG: 4Fe-4S binding protein, partial [Zoogloea sp.]|uniref:4Fe-4S binding protein n=1 Tax=Zoogloea sp. TaxID=49181 RepID=UPI003F317BBE
MRALTPAPGRIAPFFSALLLFALLALLLSQASQAGQLSRDDVARRFGPPLQVQEKLRDIPAWPITTALEPEGGPVGYVFESIDLAPIPGFEGTPMNFLVAIDRKGNFLDVELLHQHEPVFLGGLGEAPLKEFIAQYAGRNLRQQFLIAQNAARNRSGPASAQGPQTTLDGVSKATASVRIVNQTILSAALEVARAKLGFASAPKQHAPAAQARPEVADPVAFDVLLKEGMVGHLRLSNREVEALFAQSPGAGVDAYALAHPDESFVDVYIGYLNTPSIGRSILGDTQYAAAMERNFDQRHLWWIASGGRWSIMDEDFVPGAQSPRLRMAQDGLILELRDQGFEPVSPTAPAGLNAARLFGVHAAAGLDPGRTLDLTLTITRARGMILPELTHREVTLHYQPPARLFIYSPAPPPEWLLAWQARAPELAVVGAALALLSLILARPRWISVSARRLALFRWGFLGFTLLYLGWYAQGQLSIVQLTGALKALKAGQGLGSFLYDPISLLLIAFTLVSLFIWGRGTFCGWLCPFGALQEIVGKLGASALARRLGWPRLRLKPALAARLAWGGPLMLSLLILAALVAPGTGERLNEVEPFKTAITVGFDREWPYLA